MADVTARMLALLSTLQTGRSFSGEELTQRLSVSPRTLRRDVDRLRTYGYPVETQPGPGGYYRLAAGRTLPPLVLDDDEAVATLLALASLAAVGPAGGEGGVDDAALRAYGKLDQFLPARLRGRAVAVRTSLETSPQTAPAVPTELLGVIAEAITDSETISFDYRNGRGDQAIRRVEPYRQVHHLLRWYLLGWDLERGDWRVFRLDRITEIRRTGSRYQPRPLPAESATAYLRQGLNKRKQDIVLVIEAPAAAVVDALKYQDAEIHSLGPDRTGVTIALDSWQWLLVNLAFLDADFQITEAPPAFTTAWRAFATRLQAALPH
jgi:predicted DNA-binding transcriptional regulator YafY